MENAIVESPELVDKSLNLSIISSKCILNRLRTKGCEIVFHVNRRPIVPIPRWVMSRGAKAPTWIPFRLSNFMVQVTFQTFSQITGQRHGWRAVVQRHFHILLDRARRRTLPQKYTYSPFKQVGWVVHCTFWRSRLRPPQTVLFPESFSMLLGVFQASLCF